MTPITFGIVAYHEEALIERCLQSIGGVADEIILVHDGPCKDTTLDIAKRFDARIHIGERQLGSDPHRIWILQEAKNDWVFMIDADEFLSDGLKKHLKTATLTPDYGAYSVRWPLWNGEKYVTQSNYRAVLFYRPLAWAIGLHNFSVQTVGAVCQLDLVLEHQPKQNKVTFRRFAGQLGRRLDRDAKQFLKGYDGLEKYNEPRIPEQFKISLAEYLAYPRYYAWYNTLKYFLATLKNTWRDGRYGVLISMQAALYQWKLGHRIAFLKSRRQDTGSMKAK